MAFTVKNLILVLAFAILTRVNLPVASALPSVGGLAIHITNSLAARNTSMEAACPAGQPPNQAGWRGDAAPPAPSAVSSSLTTRAAVKTRSKNSSSMTISAILFGSA
ncbi:hypothetical protein CLCR_01728 [Cladophialophora carrionii]|uniref:Uncharacterized protein n=1 Tax=Cladophialophora carrionii TaxID=86049 RepID=A0A1C1CBE2_9EURO|nr:hypothetical protein CLCR_01728 [Cladophialophora carrionii]